MFLQLPSMMVHYLEWGIAMLLPVTILALGRLVDKHVVDNIRDYVYLISVHIYAQFLLI